MTDSQPRTPEQNFDATAEAYAAARRLAAAGLAVNIDGNRGVTSDGIRVLSDLCTVLMLQTGNSPSHVERTVSATARAMLAAIADLYAEMSDQPVDLAVTTRLLASATRVARTGEAPS